MSQIANMGRGGSGVSGQMLDDIQAISDPAQDTRRAAVEANAAKNLKAAQSPGAAKMRSLNDQAADTVLKHLRPRPGTPEYADELSERIADMEKKASDVKKSNTGNMGAYNTYMQVAQILKQRLAAIQDSDAGIQGPPQVQPASQPAVGQQHMDEIKPAVGPSTHQPLPMATPVPMGGQQ